MNVMFAPQHAEGLGEGVAAGLAHGHAALVAALVVGDVAQERGAHVLLDVLAAADRRVEHPHQVEQPEGDRSPTTSAIERIIVARGETGSGCRRPCR